MYTQLKLSAGVLVLGLCAACAGPGPQYFTLKPPVQLSATKSAGLDYQGFVLKHLDLPVQLDRRQMVLLNEGGAQLQLLNDYQWASPLGDEWQLAVSAGLPLRIAKPDLGVPSAGQKYWALSLGVLGFESALGQYVAQEVNWSLQAVGFTAQSFQCRLVQKMPAPGDLTQLVQAHQTLVANLLDILAAQMNDQPYALKSDVFLDC